MMPAILAAISSGMALGRGARPRAAMISAGFGASGASGMAVSPALARGFWPSRLTGALVRPTDEMVAGWKMPWSSKSPHS